MRSARLFVIMRVFVFVSLAAGFYGFMRGTQVEVAEETHGALQEVDSAQL